VRRILVPKRNKATVGWRELHTEELSDLYFAQVIIRRINSRRIRWVVHVARMRKRNVCKLFAGKPEGRRSLGKPRHSWVDNIKMGLWVIIWDGVNWIGLAQDRYRWRALVDAVINLQVP
jgi:hypothetical protein